MPAVQIRVKVDLGRNTAVRGPPVRRRWRYEIGHTVCPAANEGLSYRGMKACRVHAGFRRDEGQVHQVLHSRARLASVGVTTGVGMELLGDVDLQRQHRNEEGGNPGEGKQVRTLDHVRLERRAWVKANVHRNLIEEASCE